ncbi:hypothetical protein [Streptomyces sp. MS2.AVA.5]|uniref:Uncharacterized protein n=1 Tax=Streptomyces achmelvichensis TaxID=3134111 RepID=A0ACC6PKN4_9ACTN
MFERFDHSPAGPIGPSVRTPRACEELGELTKPFSPLIGELLALYCHTRPIGLLSQTESCRDEYQMTARQIIHHILEGWRNQTDGHGTIRDLLIEHMPLHTVLPQAPDSADMEFPHSARHR